MAVYVDDMEAPLGQMVMCHMIADSHTELLRMAARIGLQKRWLQEADTYKEHFDICKAKRRLAVSFGAVAIERKLLVKIIAARREVWLASKIKRNQPEPEQPKPEPQPQTENEWLVFHSPSNT